MNLVLGICAAVAALVGLGLLWWRSRIGKEIALMASLETSGAGSIAQMPPGHGGRGEGHAAGAPAADGGIFRPALRLLQVPRSSARKSITSATSQGRDQRKTRKTTVYSNMKYGQCLVEDQTGRVGIDFDGATSRR